MLNFLVIEPIVHLIKRLSLLFGTKSDDQIGLRQLLNGRRDLWGGNFGLVGVDFGPEFFNSEWSSALIVGITNEGNPYSIGTVREMADLFTERVFRFDRPYSCHTAPHPFNRSHSLRLRSFFCELHPRQLA